MKKMLTARVPIDTYSALEAEAASCNEPLTRTVIRHLQDHRGWTQRPDGCWDYVSLAALSWLEGDRG